MTFYASIQKWPFFVWAGRTTANTCIWRTFTCDILCEHSKVTFFCVSRTHYGKHMHMTNIHMWHFMRAFKSDLFLCEQDALPQTHAYDLRRAMSKGLLDWDVRFRKLTGVTCWHTHICVSICVYDIYYCLCCSLACCMSRCKPRDVGRICCLSIRFIYIDSEISV